MTALNTHVLIVDDEPHIANIIRRTVKEMGLSAIVVSNGKQAVDVARTLDTHLACIICDLMMPVMKGVDAIIAIRAFNPAVPVILMSVSSYDTLSEQAAMLPRISFMGKPFMVAELQCFIDQMLYEKEPVG